MTKFKSEVSEGLAWHKLKHSGFKVGTSPGGRRFRKDDMVSTPTGIFHGKIFYEEGRSQTGDWGDGMETKQWTDTVTIVEIKGDADRDLIEGRTKVILDALNSSENA